MDPQRNRWTGAPHLHERERARRTAQARRRLVKQLLIAEMITAQVEHLFPDHDRAAYARKLGQLVAGMGPAS